MQNWFEHAIIYHIYPMGFCGAPKVNTGGEPVQRLDKVLEILPHLKEMNVDTVYFGPVFESVSHGYDTTDYRCIDRRLGTNEGFARICKTLHENGIRVILDGVFNHVGRNFPQFTDIQKNGQNSPYCGWFDNLNFGGPSPCGDPFWYEGWNGHYNLVKLNLHNPAVCDYLLESVGMWIDRFDIDGLRLDAADCIDFDFFRRLRQYCKSRKPDFWLMGEIIHGDYKRWANPEMLDSVTNYECYKGIYSSHNDKNYFEIDYSINRQSGANGIYKGIALYNFVDNHDVNRIASMLNNPAHLFNVYTLLYAMPGIPSIYYGSEYGIAGRKENNSDDPLRPCYDYQELPGANRELYRHIVKLGRIYRAYPALRTGEYHTVIIRNQQVLFSKTLQDQTIFVALNLSDEGYRFEFDTPMPEMVDVLSGSSIPVSGGRACADVPPHTGMILVRDDILNREPEQPELAMVLPRTLQVGGVYRHFKGGQYRVLTVAKHSETLEELVIYQSCGEGGAVWARPKAMFLDSLPDGRERFALESNM